MNSIDQMLERRGREAVAGLLPAARKAMGQFMTPIPLARTMVGMFDVPARTRTTLLDAGAGCGALTFAAAERIVFDHMEAWEVDAALANEFRAAMAIAGRACDLRREDFVLAAAPSAPADRSHVIINPPYRKIGADSPHRQAISRFGVPVTNLYAAFLVAAAARMREGGQMVALLPRSFLNGSYFRAVRAHLLERYSLDAITVFSSRRAAFARDGVLQENVVVRLSRGPQRPLVRIGESDHACGALSRFRLVPFNEVSYRDDPQLFIRIPAAGRESGFSGATLSGLGLSVSTGPIVEYRNREHLRAFAAGAVPLVRSRDLARGGISHPPSDRPGYLSNCEQVRRRCFPAGDYVLVKRISAKESPRRLVAFHYHADRFPGPLVAFENHLNVIHHKRDGLPRETAARICEALNSDRAEAAFRSFSGSTQVNATDLRGLPLPMLASAGDGDAKPDASGPSERSMIPEEA